VIEKAPPNIRSSYIGDNEFNGDAISSFCYLDELSFLSVDKLKKICVPDCFKKTHVLYEKPSLAQFCNITDNHGVLSAAKLSIIIAPVAFVSLCILASLYILYKRDAANQPNDSVYVIEAQLYSDNYASVNHSVNDNDHLFAVAVVMNETDHNAPIVGEAVQLDISSRPTIIEPVIASVQSVEVSRAIAL
jgi:hypothetical protein